MFLNILLIVFAESLSRFHLYHRQGIAVLKHIAFGFLLAVAIANTITTFMECGFGQCPDNPVKYEYVDSSLIVTSSQR